MTSDTRVLRIRVTYGGTPMVTVRVPIGLARLVRIGGLGDRLSAQRGIDVEEILRTIDALPNEKIVDVIDEKSGDYIEIFLDADGISTTKEYLLAARQ